VIFLFSPLIYTLNTCRRNHAGGCMFFGEGASENNPCTSKPRFSVQLLAVDCFSPTVCDPATSQSISYSHLAIANKHICKGYWNAGLSKLTVSRNSFLLFIFAVFFVEGFTNYRVYRFEIFSVTDINNVKCHSTQ